MDNSLALYYKWGYYNCITNATIIYMQDEYQNEQYNDMVEEQLSERYDGNKSE